MAFIEGESGRCAGRGGGGFGACARRGARRSRWAEPHAARRSSRYAPPPYCPVTAVRAATAAPGHAGGGVTPSPETTRGISHRPPAPRTSQTTPFLYTYSFLGAAKSDRCPYIMVFSACVLYKIFRAVFCLSTGLGSGLQLYTDRWVPQLCSVHK